jgi:hypothetical protein
VLFDTDAIAVSVVKLDNASFDWACATIPELDDKRRVRKATATRMHITIRLLKPVISTPN